MIKRYIANEGFLFDWKEPRFNGEGEDREEEHLYASILFLNDNDSIENYIQVEEELAIEFYAKRETFRLEREARKRDRHI